MDAAGEGHASDDLAGELRDRAALVDEHGLGEARFVADVGHVFKPTEGIGIHERAVFAPAFNIGTTLFVVDAAGVAVVGAGEGAAFAVELQAISIATTFGKDFEFVGAWMVAPDSLT